MDGFDAYKLYLSLRLHFTSSYDAVKYNYQTKASEDKFRNMPIAYWFNTLAKKYDKKGLIDCFVAQFVAGKKWGGMGDKTFEETYLEWKKRTESIGYNFEQDMKAAKDFLETKCKIEKPVLKDLFMKVGNSVAAHRLLEIKMIRIESFVILDILTGFTVKCQNTVTDTILWPKLVFLSNKYKPFLSFDQAACKTKLLEIFPLENKE